MPALALDMHSAEMFGVFGADGGALAGRWDRLEKAQPRDFGWIGEDAGGVWMAIHPDVALADHPDMWDVVHRFWSGDCEMRPGDCEALTAHDFQLKSAMVDARQRQLARMRARRGQES